MVDLDTQANTKNILHLFDMDGTIVDSNDIWSLDNCIPAYLKHINVTFDHFTLLSDLHEFTKPVDFISAWECIISKYMPDSGVTIEEHMTRAVTLQSDKYDKLKITDDALSYMMRMKKLGHKIIICSANRLVSISKFINSNKLVDIIDAVYCSDSVKNKSLLSKNVLYDMAIDHFNSDKSLCYIYDDNQETINYTTFSGYTSSYVVDLHMSESISNFMHIKSFNDINPNKDAMLLISRHIEAYPHMVKDAMDNRLNFLRPCKLYGITIPMSIYHGSILVQVGKEFVVVIEHNTITVMPEFKGTCYNYKDYMFKNN